MRTVVIGFITFISLFIVGGIGLSFMSVDVQQTEVVQTLTIKDLASEVQ